MRLLLTMLLALPALAKPVGGEDFTRKDRTALLYQTKFRFTADNIPIVNVLIMEDAGTIKFSSEGPIEFKPDDGSSVRVERPHVTCTATLQHGKAARVRYWPSLERITARDLEAVRVARSRWETRGFAVRSFELGSVFGFYGRVLDNRVQVLVEDRSFETMEEARQRGAVITGENADVFEEMVERPDGVINIVCEGVSAEMMFSGMVEAGAENGRLKVYKVEFGRGFPWHSYEDRTYRGSLIFTPDRRGRLAVVNSVDAETMLEGLVPSEIYVDAPFEALKAQAVVARGELFAKLGQRHTADPYMICGDVHCQVYRGTVKENARTSRAVRSTRGEMVFIKDTLVDSVYSASCGGHTEDGKAVWQTAGHDYLKGVPDGPAGVRPYTSNVNEESVAAFIDHPPAGLYCGSSRFGRDAFRWKKTVTKTEIRRGVLEQTGKDIGEVEGLKVLERGVSGRITRLEVLGSKGVVELSPELKIRKALGSLKSSLFVFTNDREGFTFRGAGFGHGVGLCQNGAVGMAEAGATYREIISHYFSGSEVVKIY